MNIVKSLWFSITVLAMLSGCGSVGSQQFDNKGIKIADENMVKDCEFKGDVSGLSSFYGLFAAPAYSEPDRKVS